MGAGFKIPGFNIPGSDRGPGTGGQGGGGSPGTVGGPPAGGVAIAPGGSALLPSILAGGSLAYLAIQQNKAQKRSDKAIAGLAGEQQRQAAAAEQRLREQPRRISPDNFLAMKNKMLLNMRLGLMSSLPGAAGAAAPALSAPSLSGSTPGKSRLGA